MLQQCEPLPLQIVKLPDGPDIIDGPYFLFAFELGGPTTMDEIGSSPGSVSWTVNHKSGTYSVILFLLKLTPGISGSQVILEVADSQGNSGGSAPQIFTVSRKKSQCQKQNLS
jgi:hypothetical protein